MDRPRGDRVRRGLEGVAAHIRDKDARVGNGLKEQALSRRASEATLARRANHEAAGGLSVAYGERPTRDKGCGHGLLVAGLGMVTAVVEALVEGGRVVHRKGDHDASCAGPQPGILEGHR